MYILGRYVLLLCEVRIAHLFSFIYFILQAHKNRIPCHQKSGSEGKNFELQKKKKLSKYVTGRAYNKKKKKNTASSIKCRGWVATGEYP